MVKPLVGEIVVLPFPNTDLRVGKRQGDDLILCQITSQARISDGYSVSLDSPDF